jgi:hypothetical protein
MSLAITWYDNAAFRVVTEEHILWFDPSVNKNSGSPIRTADINERADFVFTTHGDPGQVCRFRGFRPLHFGEPATSAGSSYFLEI